MEEREKEEEEVKGMNQIIPSPNPLPEGWIIKTIGYTMLLFLFLYCFALICRALKGRGMGVRKGG
jgi:hypothetical protein